MLNHRVRRCLAHADAVVGHAKRFGCSLRLAVRGIVLTGCIGANRCLLQLDASLVHHVAQLGEGSLQRLPDLGLGREEAGRCLVIRDVQHDLQWAHVGWIQGERGRLLRACRHPHYFVA